jgi:hypothetical protein
MLEADKFLPAAKRWGGGPPEGWWRGIGSACVIFPSTMLRMVPLPISQADGEEP